MPAAPSHFIEPSASRIPVKLSLTPDFDEVHLDVGDFQAARIRV
jgi:hypothetical protein